MCFMLVGMQTPPRVRGRAAGARLRAIALTSLLAGPAVLLALAASVAAPAAHASRDARSITPMKQLERKVLASINDLRRARGLTALRLNPVLSDAASQHSVSMAEHGFFHHASLNGAPFWKRDVAVYPRRAYRLWSVGENLAYGAPRLSAGQAIELWLASPSHRANLLSPTWREVGLGAVHAVAAGGVYDGRDVTIVTADFGVRRSS